MLSDAQRAYRRGKITASLAREIMNATTDAEMLALYDQAIDETPVTETYAMRAGAAMEDVIRNEYALRYGTRLTRVQDVVDHPTITDFMATLDGVDAERNRIVEIKFASPFLSRDEIFRIYYPQCAFQLACADLNEGLLFVGQGTSEPWEAEIVRDTFTYEPELIARCQAFLLCLRTMSPPTARPHVTPPEKWKVVDLNDRSLMPPNWAGELINKLGVYADTAAAAELHEQAGKLARELVPEDVGKVIAGNFTLSRNKKGVLTIRRAA